MFPEYAMYSKRRYNLTGDGDDVIIDLVTAIDKEPLIGVQRSGLRKSGQIVKNSARRKV